MIRFRGLVLGILIFTPGPLVGQELQRFRFSEPHMGTEFTITVLAEDSASSVRGVAEAFARIETINAHLSDYSADSEVNALSAAAGTSGFVLVSDDLWNVLVESQHIAIETRGLFDVTVGPLTRLWRWASRRDTLPAQEDIKEAQALTGYKKLELDDNTKAVRLRKVGMRIDLGGIAKGYAADEALKSLEQNGMDHGVVDAGGDIALGKGSWAIVLADTTVHLGSCGVAVSGSTYRFVEHQGTRYSHILDPRTGLGLTHHRTVGVIAPSAMEADVLASAVSVMTEKELERYSERKNINLCHGVEDKCLSACARSTTSIMTW